MNKQQIIDQIRRYNPTADVTFLSAFLEEELLAYLHQLSEIASERRRRESNELLAVG